MLERDIEDGLKKLAARLGGEVRKVKWIGRRGAPDRLVLLPGCSVWVELKKPGEPLQDHQRREHERMRKAGLAVFTFDNLHAMEFGLLLHLSTVK